MVTARVISERFEIPRSTLYRLVREGRIPVHDVTKPWHDRQQYRFLVSEVEAAFGKPAAPPDPAP